VASFALYIIATWGDYRVIFAHLLLVLLIMVLRRNYLPLILVILINLLFMPIFYQQSGISFDRKYPSAADSPYVIELSNMLNETIIYDENTDNRWCNTMLISLDYVSDMELVPAGIGTSVIISDHFGEQPLHSQYLWLTEVHYNILLNRETPANLTVLFPVNNGFVLLNEDAECN
jgi:hypothetical protein